MKRARAFRHIMMNKAVKINRGELIAGERGTEPKATPTYPEVCLHSLEVLDVFDSREKVFFRVSDKVKKHYKETIIPYWKGRSMRERIFNEVSEEWKEAYEAGMFTEFQEQRAPGHTVLGDKIYRKGLRTFIAEIEEGSLTVEWAKELLQSFWIKFNNHPAPPKVGITAKESNTYTDFALINLGD